MKHAVGMCAILLLIQLLPASAPRAGLHCLETENLRLIYLDGLHSSIAPHVARCFENSMRFHREFWDYKLPEKVTVFLHDISDHGNGAAKNIPRDLILVAIAPFNYTFETMPANERMNTIMNHELVHIYAMDRAAGIDKFYRHLFWGKPVPTADNPLSIIYDYMACPRRSAPRWYQEGIAVFLETWMAGGYGRAMGAYDEMVFRAMVHDNQRFYDPVGLEAEGTKIDFHVGVNSYLYGTRFFSYLALKYGPQRPIQWVSRTNQSKAYFVSQFKKTFGISLDEAWAEWIAWEKQYQRDNLDSIGQYPTTPFHDITTTAVGSVSRGFYDPSDRMLYVGVNYPGRIAHLASIDVDRGEIKSIRDVKGPALFYVCSTAFDSSTHSLFYTTDNYGWRDLCVVNIRTGAAKTLMKDGRIGDLTFNPVDRSLWGVRHFNGISTIVRIPHPYDEWNTIYPWPYGQDIYDIDISPDGRYLAGSLAGVSGRQRLIMMEVEQISGGDTTFTTLHDFGNCNPGGFVFSGNGRFLYGASYYTGVSNIFRYNIAADSMEALSNCNTGFFRPIPITEDSLIVFRYTGKGFVPAIIRGEPLEDINPIRYLGQTILEKHPVVSEWMAGSPADIDLDSAITSTGTYRALSSVRPVSAYPVVEGYKDYVAAGMRVDFSDFLALHTADITASYTPSRNLPDNERWHVKANYKTLGWLASFTYNGADFYDLFGPTKTSRKGYSLGLQYERNLLYDGPKTVDLGVGVTGYAGLERLPDYQNIAASYDEFVIGSVDLAFKNLRASLGAVDYEKGIRWEVSSSNTYVNGEHYPQVVGNLAWAIPLPLHHSSIWLRTSGGYAPGDWYEPFANFYFGGFGNNWVDHLAEKRYRKFYSFPGLELNEIGGTNFGKVGLEWSLPPLHFRRLGVPALYCSWVRLALFGGGIVTSVDDPEVRDRVVNAGAQLDIRMQLLSNLRLTLSGGYAVAAREDRRKSEEFMISLKVL